MRRTLRVCVVFLAAWLAGLVAYVGALGLLCGQSISSGDLSAVLFSSLLAFAVAFAALYVPVLSGLRRLLHGVRPLWPFPVVAALLGVIPTALIVFFGGGNLGALMSPEAGLFYLMFAAAGAVGGLGLAQFCWQHNAV